MFDLIDVPNSYLFQVTWDVGRRCNYDCTYCGPGRHNNWSPHASLDSLIDTADFVLEYCDLYVKHRKVKEINLNFTGGEPTTNKNLMGLFKYIRQQLRDYKITIALTTNGAFPDKMLPEIKRLVNQVTVSYHCEASDAIKLPIQERIFKMHEMGIELQVNVMMHQDHEFFKECQELCYKLKDRNIQYVPRVIGDHEEDIGTPRSHKYNDEQMLWLRNHWSENKDSLTNTENANKNHCTGAYGASHKSEQNKIGIDEGRPCCGSRVMCTVNKKKRELTRFINRTNFKDWYCSVNWFFLHIQQEAQLVFHHQSCQARFDHRRGPIGPLRKSDKIIADLKQKLETGTLDLIKCPNTFCGCGICTPKSSDKEKLMNALPQHFNIEVLNDKN
jgi:MoaA/NifB/PqqE/SkfB family radical SAM enzyme